ncbi:ETC complex I subunit conserved region-domain-containing protein [Podospora appendiculata]|uniref:ETC complex I subunit conserved region-domain-containing protein n=1 Tax=Podospora appendiculata TaxID=314037 RepID=A0AAE0X938_9PEZI|nr:ETC complex I subunit conserved region-domain-containing protein [Podospora appendiculata]
MRRTFRQLASVKPARYLEAGTPTGLTGLRTHISPRSTLLYLYSSTLEKIQAAPAHSLYRQSVEAVTKHRMALVEAVVPPGHAEWAERTRATLAAHPEQFKLVSSETVDGAAAIRVERDGRAFVVRHVPKPKDERVTEWDGEIDEGAELEGTRSLEEKADLKLLSERSELIGEEGVKWEAEPQLTADQVEELENKIGAGLIEEVVEVAEGELRLVDTMLQAKVWETLEEQPAEGQWVYFERKP